MKHLGILGLYALTAIDLRKSEAPPKHHKQMTLSQKIITNCVSVVVAVGSGFVTAVACVGLHPPAILEYLFGITARSLPWLAAWAGYRVNMGVYKSAIEYTLKSFFLYGPLYERVTKDDKDQPIPGEWQRMSFKKSCGVLVGIALSYLGSGALTAFFYVSMHKGLALIFGGIGLTGAACPPIIIALALTVAAISFTAIFSLMYKSIHTAIRNNAFESFIKFVKDLKPDSDLSTKEKIQHWVISACKVVFIAGGVTAALIATFATFGAWSNALVHIITHIDKAWAGAAKIFSIITVFGFTAAGRLPMVTEKAATVFAVIGEYCGKLLNFFGVKICEKIGLTSPNIPENNTQNQHLLSNSQSDTNKYSFTSLGQAAVAGIGVIVVTVTAIASIFINADGNAMVATEGGSVLANMLNSMRIEISMATQKGLSFFTGGFVSAVLGVYAAIENYITGPSKPAEKKDSSIKITEGLAPAAPPSLVSVAAPSAAPSVADPSTGASDEVSAAPSSRASVVAAAPSTAADTTTAPEKRFQTPSSEPVSRSNSSIFGSANASPALRTPSGSSLSGVSRDSSGSSISEITPYTPIKNADSLPPPEEPPVFILGNTR